MRTCIEKSKDLTAKRGGWSWLSDERSKFQNTHSVITIKREETDKRERSERGREQTNHSHQK